MTTREPFTVLRLWRQTKRVIKMAEQKGPTNEEYADLIMHHNEGKNLKPKTEEENLMPEPTSGWGDKENIVLPPKCTCTMTADTVTHPDCPFKAFHEAVEKAMRYLSLAEAIICHECHVAGAEAVAYTKNDPLFLIPQAHYNHLVNSLARAGFNCDVAEHIYREDIVFYGDSGAHPTSTSMECCACKEHDRCDLYRAADMSQGYELLLDERKSIRKLTKKIEDVRGITPEDLTVVKDCDYDWDRAQATLKVRF